MKKDWFRLNRSQRMQLKGFICLLGIMLLFILLLGRLFILQTEREVEKYPPEHHIPVIHILENVWIIEEDTEGLTIFREGTQEKYPWGTIAESESQNGENASEAAENGAEESGIQYRPGISVREQVADITLTDGRITEVKVKGDKINGRVLSAGQDWIEVEGYGKLMLTENHKGYRLYDSLNMCTADDLIFGYDFTDFCMEDGRICAILMVKEEVMKYIRVLLRTSDFEGLFHETVVLTADTDFTVSYGEGETHVSEKFSAGEEIEFLRDGMYLSKGRVTVVPDVLTGKVILKSLNRSQGVPAYRGSIEMRDTEEGIVVINQVLLEEYLYSVVPSEMPSGYPAEALKAQAICARTYAYGHMEHAGYPKYGAHVDDSTLYQVYNNIREQASTTAAAKDTYGQLLYTADGQLAGTYYYSTSCGVGSDATVWKTESASEIDYLEAKAINREAMEAHISKLPDVEQVSGESAEAVSVGEKLREENVFYEYITTRNEEDFECNETWYRWTYEVKELNPETILDRLKERYQSNKNRILTLQDEEYISKPVKTLGKILRIEIVNRGPGGVADELVIEGEKNTYKVITEHNIRYVLDDGEAMVVRQDGGKSSFPTILPSGFFVITTEVKDGVVAGYMLIGGGFGHGVGMSQNGAKEMAKSGYQAGEILLFFYENCSINQIYE
ncbi:MAG: SpoIID/LytB domain-containing protein [Acetatifactor sp.]